MKKMVGDFLVIRSLADDIQTAPVIHGDRDIYDVENTYASRLELESYEILANYGPVHYTYVRDLDVLTFERDEALSNLRRYYLDFPAQPHIGKYLDDETGWLSPEGVLYPCPYSQHLNAADHILVSRCGRDFGGDEELEGLGWVKVQRDGSVAWPLANVSAARSRLTQPQIDTLFDMLMDATTDLRKRELTGALKDALGEQFDGLIGIKA